MPSPVDIAPRIAADLKLPRGGVAAVLELLADGSTVPFIARYRKEATGGLDEVAIRAIGERQSYVTELESRRETVLASIAEQGALTAELAERIAGAETKTELEDLYLPYRPKRRTRATKARERGLEPLADRLLAQPATGSPEVEAAGFVDSDKGVEDVASALAGARDIAAEAIAERADVRAAVRRVFRDQGEIVSEVARDYREQRTKFEQYYAFREAVGSIPSHRFLAIRRGEAEGVLRVRIEVDAEALLGKLADLAGVRPSTPFGSELMAALADGYKRLLRPSIENEVMVELKQRSDEAAVGIFAENLRNLLLAPPLGGKPVVGIDPGQRTGCKCAAVDATGRFLGHTTVYLVGSDEVRSRAERDLVAFVEAQGPAVIAVGNGTGGREALAFAKEVLERALSPETPRPAVVQVNEAGASVYSASDIARDEFPELDLTVRGAISIARRLQDPLAELVKIDPKSIGVGQYQHDVHQPMLSRKLEEVVESCVNHVGVELNTASAPLLAHVAGLGGTLSKRIVAHRNEHGPFRTRRAVLKVHGVGPRTFEQCAGFLRIRDGDHPLDASAVHPERYDLVERMAADAGVRLGQLVGNAELAARIPLARYVGGGVGEPTLRDIIAELEKPGRDPREPFEPPRFRDDVQALEDLKPGMSLEGVVTNVVAFGAFVDVGVHQDGLVHISKLADRYVKDPSEVVKVGDRIRVKVLDVDLARRRISLSARASDEATPRPPRGDREDGEARGRSKGKAGAKGKPRSGGERAKRSSRGGSKRSSSFSNNPFGDLKKS